ncbi:MAG: SAM-dependent methyltransferase [Bacteroidales bacterium]|nr:SAM-dependent methyltransferase [Bacteroidales bacterium]
MDKATEAYIEQHLNDNIRQLALSNIPVDVDKDLALRQITARQLLKQKVPLWANNASLLFPPRLNIEQCSSELTANYKASLVTTGETFTDLTGGTGIDCFFLSQKFRQSTYVETQTMLCDIMTHNSNVLNTNIKVCNTTTENYLSRLQTTQDLLFIDPARRDMKGEKTVLITQCSPNIEPLWDTLLSKGKLVMVKLSPMLDIQLTVNILKHIKEIHVIAVDGECKELLLLAEHNYTKTPQLYCVELGKKPHIQTFSSHIDTTAFDGADTIGTFLFEPDATIMKAGIFNTFAQHYKIKPLDKSTHLMTGNRIIENFFGHQYTIDTILPYNKHTEKEIPEEWKKANLTTRNFPIPAEQLRKKLKLKGFSERFIVGTTFHNQHIIILCTRI